MKEDVEMTELALAFPLFDDSGSTSSLRIRHQVKFTSSTRDLELFCSLYVPCNKGDVRARYI